VHARAHQKRARVKRARVPQPAVAGAHQAAKKVISRATWSEEGRAVILTITSCPHREPPDEREWAEA
jgi:hypothetical protein